MKSKPIPKFKSEEDEREFWSKKDSVDYIDWNDAKPVVLPNLKPSQKTNSLRLPEMMLAQLKVLANKRDVPYQSLRKNFLAERIAKEMRLEEKRKQTAEKTGNCQIKFELVHIRKMHRPSQPLTA